MSQIEKSLRIKINILGFILSCMAGWVNIVGAVVFIDEDIAFMTGRFMLFGYYLHNKKTNLLIEIVIIITFFFLGAFFSSIATKKYGLEGGLFLSGSFIGLALIPISFFPITLLPFALGAQNAASSLTILSRTTHLTGVVTDLANALYNKKWSNALFNSLKVLGHPLGVLIGLFLLKYLNVSLVLIIPSLIVLTLALVQKYYFKIPLK